MKNIEGQAFYTKEPNTALEAEPKIKHSEIEELREPMMHMLEQMRERIDRGEYNLIIGDDASGRVPTWVFYNFLKKVYARNNLPPPSVRYFAGSRRAMEGSETAIKKEEEIAKHIARFIERKAKNNETKTLKALVVTDTIETGGSLLPAIKALKKHDLPLDIATISFIVGKNETKVRNRFGVDIFYGTPSGNSIYGRGDLSGVAKNAPDVFSEPMRKLYPYPGAIDVQKIREVRADSKTLASQLAEWYEAGLSR